MKKKGFTLVELLVVVAIIGILAGLITTAIVKTYEIAKKKRHDATLRELQAAILAYWHDYGEWPLSLTSGKEKDYTSGKYTAYTNATSNGDVFKHLRADDSKLNPLGRAYLDEADPRYKDLGTKTLTCRNPYHGDKEEPYRVIINFERNDVTIDLP